MPLSPLEKIVLEYVLLADETGSGRLTTYADLGRTLCRCEHSVKAAVATLRKAGLVITARTSYGTSSLSFTASPFVSWASCLLRRTSSMQLARASEGVAASTAAGVHPGEAHAALRRHVREQAPVAKKRRAADDAAEGTATPPYEPPVQTDADGKPLMAPQYDGEFDNTVEVADTLRAAGRTVNAADDDEDDFSLGSDTAETDIGQDVRINPNI
jgi:hypothetical protein